MLEVVHNQGPPRIHQIETLTRYERVPLPETKDESHKQFLILGE